MADARNAFYLVNDLLTLPIIISDWDLIAENRRRASDAAIGSIRPDSPVGSVDEVTAAQMASRPHWKSGFSGYVDNLWQNMSDKMKQKLRDACVEVLRRTDDVRDESLFQYVDDDARLLD